MTRLDRDRDLGVRVAAVALLLGFAVFWLRALLVYAVDLPVWDQWMHPLDQIIKMFAGELEFFRDLWPQHNESRKLFPHAVSMALAALLGRYDTQAELAVGAVFMVAIAVALWRLGLASRLGPSAALCLALLFVAAGGSPRTFIFHSYSITFERLVPALALAASLALLLRRGLGLATAGVAAALLTVGQYSYAGGFLGWLLVLGFGLAAHRGARGPLLLLGACAAAASLAYFHHYSAPGVHAGAFLRTSPADWARFFLLYLGNPVTGSLRLEKIAGLTALLGFAVAAWQAWRRAPDAEARRAALAWMALGLDSLGQGLMATVGRLPLGMGNAQRPDYILHPVFLYMATAALVCLAAPGRRWARGLVAAMLGVSAAVFLTLFSPASRQHMRELRTAWMHSKACLVLDGLATAAACEDSPKGPWPDASFLREQVRRARRFGLLQPEVAPCEGLRLEGLSFVEITVPRLSAWLPPPVVVARTPHGKAYLLDLRSGALCQP